MQNLILNQDGQDIDGVDEQGNTTSTSGNWMTDFEVSGKGKCVGLWTNDSRMDRRACSRYTRETAVLALVAHCQGYNMKW